MARFQASTHPVLDEALELLRQELGLRDNQKAELLRELALIAGWVVGQLRAGRVVEGRGPDGVEVFRHPALTEATAPVRVVLTEAEARSLAALMDEPPAMSSALAATLRRVASAAPPPALAWPPADEEPPLAAEPRGEG